MVMNFILHNIILLMVVLTASCSKAIAPSESNKLENSSINIEVDYSYDGDTVRIVFINKSETETYSIFTSYFNPLYAKSKYLFRYDSGIESFKYSFLPLVNFVNTVPTDKRIITDEALFNEHQVIYKFEVIRPGEQFSLAFHKDVLCDKNLDEVILDFDANEITWSEIQRTNSAVEMKRKMILEFAFYQDTDVLRKKGEEYRNPKEFKEKAKSYNVVSLPLKCK
jgi:hypothetical protein